MPKLLVAKAPGDSDDTGYPFNMLFDGVSVIEPGMAMDGPMNEAGALILYGGQDISPSLYGEPLSRFSEADIQPSRRDLFEWTLIKCAEAHQVPVIGICRGAQILCAYDGGKLAQDISGHGSGHDILTKEGETFWAAGSHHQMMLPGDWNILLATSYKQMHEGFYLDGSDAINNIPIGWLEPEAVYFPKIKAVGFQFHPEWMDKEKDAVRWAVNVVRDYLLVKETV